MIKLGTVPFLNVRPLIFPLEEGLVEHDFEIVYAPPSDLSDMIFEKRLDLGLIPVAELLRKRNYGIVPNVSISSWGKVDSVVLLTKSKISDLTTVAVDARSQSSTALLKVILEIFHKVYPVYVKRKPGSNFLDGVDGGMIIGNAGLKLKYFPPAGYNVFDLGEIWTDETGLPFVYAVYAVNEGVNLDKNLEALAMAKSQGLRCVERIAETESKKLGLSREICFTYITERIKYDLGEKEMQGILTYGKFLLDLGEITEITDLKILS